MYVLRGSEPGDERDKLVDQEEEAAPDIEAQATMGDDSDDENKEALWSKFVNKDLS